MSKMPKHIYFIYILVFFYPDYALNKQKIWVFLFKFYFLFNYKMNIDTL